MNQNVLTLPASGTCKIIYEHSIHAFPYPKPYKETPYVAFRETGGFIKELYTVRDRFVLSPPYNATSTDLARFDPLIQQRILTYIQDRKKGFGFENPDRAYMFWHNLTIKLWETIKPPPSLLDNQLEGPTEVDVMIESEDFVWFIEAKFIPSI